MDHLAFHRVPGLAGIAQQAKASADSAVALSVQPASAPATGGRSGGPVATTAAEPDPRIVALAERLEGQLSQTDELIPAFRERALTALAEGMMNIPGSTRERAALLDSAARLAGTIARLIHASALASETVARLRGGGHRQVIRVERAVFVGDRGGRVTDDE